jgi:hypothetical protein
MLGMLSKFGHGTGLGRADVPNVIENVIGRCETTLAALNSLRVGAKVVCREPHPLSSGQRCI